MKEFESLIQIILENNFNFNESGQLRENPKWKMRSN